MDRPTDILCIGELNPDLILSGLDAGGPVLGSEQIFADQTLTLGSSTAITCVLLQRLGLQTALASLVGDDEYGRFCLAALAREGVNIGRVRIDQAIDTGVTISVTYPNDRLLLTRLGSLAVVDAGVVPQGAFADVTHVHSGSVFLLDALRADLPDVLRRAQTAGCSVSLDPGWDPSERWDPAALDQLLPLCDVFLPNRSEALAMTGAQTPQEALARLRARGARRVALKAGRDGGFCDGPEGLIASPRLSGAECRIRPGRATPSMPVSSTACAPDGAISSACAWPTRAGLWQWAP